MCTFMPWWVREQRFPKRVPNRWPVRLSIVPGIKMFVVSACDSVVGYTTYRSSVLLVAKQYQKDGLLNDIGRSSSQCLPEYFYKQLDTVCSARYQNFCICLIQLPLWLCVDI